MVFEILLFLVLGIAIGTLMGLIPGIHPNMIILTVPLLLAINLDPHLTLTFLVSMGVTNIFVDFIPSLLFGAPDSESGLATLPGHRMLMKGKGHHAVRLAVTGGLMSIILVSILLPLLALGIPPLYSAIRPYTHFLLIAIVALLVLSEKLPKKIFWSAVCLGLAGSIGILSSRLPIDTTVILFPILSGFFGVPSLLLHSGGNNIPDQKFGKEAESRRKSAKSVTLGTTGGILSGLLPGIGVGSLAAFATIDRNDRSFLTTLGAISASNALISFLALWLIGNPRSGVAVAAEQLVSIDFNLFLLIAFVSLFAAAISTPLTLVLSKKSLGVISRINYSRFSRAILLVILFLVAVFTGPLGLLLFGTCSALGIFAGRIGIKRGILMGVLIIPTILFFAGI